MTTSGDDLLSERVAGGILPKVLTTFDMVAIWWELCCTCSARAAGERARPEPGPLTSGCQCSVAFSAPTPVSERTSISAYLAALYSLLRTVPR